MFLINYSHSEQTQTSENPQIHLVSLRGCLRSIISYLPWRLEIAAIQAKPTKISCGKGVLARQQAGKGEDALQ